MTKRRLLGLSVAVGLALLLPVAVATPASAVGLPCGNVCDGKDPQTYRVQITTHDPDVYVICASDATTVRTRDVGTYRLQLRYSPNCETTWLRVVDLGTGALLPNRIKHVSKYPSGTVRKTVWGYGLEADGSWSNMLNDHNLLNHGCIYTYNGEDDYARGIVYQSGCTGAY